MLTPTWQMDLFIYEYFILIPIYIFILLGILITRNRHKTFQSPYYTMMVSQGLADVCTVTIYIVIIGARYFSIGNVFIYNLSPYSSYSFSNTGPFMFTLRGVGVFFITTQRYLAVCRSHGTLNYRLNQCPPLLIGFTHWLVAFLIYLPALLHTDIYFENEVTLLTVGSTTFVQWTSLTVMTSYFVTCVSIIIMYSQIAVVMVRARKVEQGVLTSTKTTKKLKDARLTLHVFILVLFCIVTFFFYIGEYVLATDADNDRVRALRLFYPTLSGNLSFINPIMLLMMNRDVQSAFCCRFKVGLMAENGREKPLPRPRVDLRSLCTRSGKV
ncbi:G-protein coupled receptors family 1 profile domain-containing protein [Caenorhabditis elegans]|uniref:G-protein coupled receptors family 1 profile domain-containing protein n=1 Tax=Caenorhabditis elegans TaxID=6239 RepID=O45353_CAEEL|nr:G-protein coupled receptors family 1 profile domain-containing protein [Caenorhabditis elegans]CAB07575.2 G-protein coupled receptors family 1 profile domain-containing protein [Caenorhabditis elegans]|eukprot:NP_507135.2 Serpentine Receptor, class V [Caenorhabditis elegans]